MSLVVCERRKLTVNIGKSKFVRCSRYINLGRMHVTLNGEMLEEVNCFKYLGSKVAADGRSERDVVHNESGVRSVGALTSVLNNRGVCINERKCPYEWVIVPTTLRSAVRRIVNV